MTHQCPFVNEAQPNPTFNSPMQFECQSGFVYTYYQHSDGFGDVYNCQFCTLIGRKRDVFECLNEKEWKECPHYKAQKDNSTNPVEY